MCGSLGLFKELGNGEYVGIKEVANQERIDCDVVLWYVGRVHNLSLIDMHITLVL